LCVWAEPSIGCPVSLCDFARSYGTRVDLMDAYPGLRLPWANFLGSPQGAAMGQFHSPLVIEAAGGRLTNAGVESSFPADCGIPFSLRDWGRLANDRAGAAVLVSGTCTAYLVLVALKCHLPAVALHCSIGAAYQAADASHPRRVERARRRARKFRRIRANDQPRTGFTRRRLP
jgi:hypothetical protein